MKNSQGYWLVYKPDHHLADYKGYVLEHRLNWEQANGRELRPEEVVHHIDANRENNSPGNLVAITQNKHFKLHMTKESRSLAAERMRATKNTESNKAKVSALKLQMWSDPLKRQKQSETLKRFWATKKQTS